MNRMKKFMAMLLAVVLVAQSGFMTYATEDNGSADQIQTIDATEEADRLKKRGRLWTRLSNLKRLLAK